MGWRVVREYDMHPLADGSDDERRLYRAETRANRKFKQEKAKRSKRRFSPYSRPVTATQGQYCPDSGSVGKKPGLCFLCRKPGHWKNECELANNNASNSNNKLSNSDFVTYNILFAPDTSYRPVALCENQSGVTLSTYTNSCTTFQSGNSESQVTGSNIKTGVLDSPVGKLKAAQGRWKEAGANAYIMRVITEGYRIPFRQLPSSDYMKNNKTARENMNFVLEEVSNLMRKGCVSQVFDKPWVVNPLTVAFGKTGKKRLVLDCRHLNQFLITYKFKYEDINTAMQMFEKGSYLFSFDLKGAYHHIEIYEEHRTYLGFSIEQDGKIKYFVFNVLPFGIASAGHIFSKVLRVLVSYWRSQGHKVIMYLDDGIGGHSDCSKARVLSQYLQKSLPEFGLLIAIDKCHWEPVFRLEWLGYCLDMSVARIYVTDERIKRLEAAIDSVLYQIRVSSLNVVKVRVVASVVGQVISLQTVMGKIVSLKTRALYECILSRASWEAPILVTQDAINELVFWRTKARFMNLNGRAIKENLEAEVELFCDASAEGYGGYFSVTNNVAHCFGTDSICETILSEKETCSESTTDLCDQSAECKGGDSVSRGATCDGIKACNEACSQFPEVKFGVGCSQEVVGSWSKQEMLKSSTWREAEAIRRILVSNLAVFEGKKLKIYSDNKNVKTVLRSGSTKVDLQTIALQIYNVCEKRDITLIPEWIPREKNTRADFLSRCHDCDDWEINNLVFRDLDNRWGPHTVDRFATNYNNKCMRFNSRWWVPEAEAVNAFDQDWSNDCNWMVPPPRLISLCFEKIEKDQASGTLVVPEWKSAPFWTKLVQDDCSFVQYVSDFEFLPLQNAISRGKGNNGVFGKENVQFRMIALKIRFIK